MLAVCCFLGGLFGRDDGLESTTTTKVAGGYSRIQFVSKPLWTRRREKGGWGGGGGGKRESLPTLGVRNPQVRLSGLLSELPHRVSYSNHKRAGALRATKICGWFDVVKGREWEMEWCGCRSLRSNDDDDGGGGLCDENSSQFLIWRIATIETIKQLHFQGRLVS